MQDIRPLPCEKLHRRRTAYWKSKSGTSTIEQRSIYFNSHHQNWIAIVDELLALPSLLLLRVQVALVCDRSEQAEFIK